MTKGRTSADGAGGEEEERDGRDADGGAEERQAQGRDAHEGGQKGQHVVLKLARGAHEAVFLRCVFFK